MTARRVLVVDDDEDLREALRLVLGDAGWAVDLAPDGAAGLLALAERPRPDVILLDSMMPVMDGERMRRALLADPGTADLPVVFLSADRRLGARATELRAAAVLAKPVKLEVLLDALALAANAARRSAGRAAERSGGLTGA